MRLIVYIEIKNSNCANDGVQQMELCCNIMHINWIRRCEMWVKCWKSESGNEQHEHVQSLLKSSSK